MKISRNKNTGRAFKPLYQLDNPKGYKTFAIRKKNHRFIKNNISTYSLTHFPYTFLSITHEYTFISASHIIYNIECVKQTGKSVVILMKSIFTAFLKDVRKLIFMKKSQKMYLIDGAGLFIYIYNFHYML